MCVINKAVVLVSFLRTLISPRDMTRQYIPYTVPGARFILCTGRKVWLQIHMQFAVYPYSYMPVRSTFEILSILRIRTFHHGAEAERRLNHQSTALQ
jgi:hypothetical protein